MRKRRIYPLLSILLGCLLAALLAGCATQEQDSTQITELRQLDGQRIGVITGSVFDTYTDQFIQDAKKEYYSA